MVPLDFLTPISSVIVSFKDLLEIWINQQDRKDREDREMMQDLGDLVNELSNTLTFCVNVVSPVRHMNDDPQTFANDFKNIYNDFRDKYDAYAFVKEQMSCYQIDHIVSQI